MPGESRLIMALNLEAVKKQINTVGSPIFENRVKGSWESLYNSGVEVTETQIYTDSKGDTYGVMVFAERPGEFYLCGKVATELATAVCTPENGGTFDESGIMTDHYFINIGIPKKTKQGNKTYLPVTLTDGKSENNTEPDNQPF